MALLTAGVGLFSCRKVIRWPRDFLDLLGRRRCYKFAATSLRPSLVKDPASSGNARNTARHWKQIYISNVNELKLLFGLDHLKDRQGRHQVQLAEIIPNHSMPSSGMGMPSMAFVKCDAAGVTWTRASGSNYDAIERFARSDFKRHSIPEESLRRMATLAS
jgi:hypothetical protein